MQFCILKELIIFNFKTFITRTSFTFPLIIITPMHNILTPLYSSNLDHLYICFYISAKKGAVTSKLLYTYLHTYTYLDRLHRIMYVCTQLCNVFTIISRKKEEEGRKGQNGTCTTHTLVNYATLDMSIKSQISTSYLLGLGE